LSSDVRDTRVSLKKVLSTAVCIAIAAFVLVNHHRLPKVVDKAAEVSDISLRWAKFKFAPSVVVHTPANSTPIPLETIRRPMTTSPLKVSRSNPRYFEDGNGNAVYLTGSHTWNNRQDFGDTVFDYPAYLDFLVAHNHNFIRLWVWEEAKGLQDSNVHPGAAIMPTIYSRTGPGVAKDDLPRFDVSRLNQEFFDRLRSRVIAARDRGIYVSIMLFDGWSIENKDKPLNPWEWHPFNRVNNVNNLDGDPNHDGNGEETQTLQLPAIIALDEAYVRKVIDSVNDLDNVLYEVSNETGGTPAATQWEYHIIDFVKRYEATQPKQHLIGMTMQHPGGNNADLFNSQADWISPGRSAPSYYDYKTNPAPSDGSKVLIADTDHLWGVGGDRVWAWKSFLRGLNIAYMDTYRGDYISTPPDESLRRNMGYIATYANRMKLAAVTPRNDLASTGYCLANSAERGAEFLVYAPSGGPATVDLSAAKGELSAEWFNPSNGMTFTGIRATGGGYLTFVPPFEGDAILYIHAN
jgi:hypothetical protein